MRNCLSIVYLAVLLCSGCASITTGELQSVAIQTQRPDGSPVDKADCKLSNDKGMWSVVAPAIASVSRSSATLNVACSKEGEPSGTVMAISRMHGGMVGNLLFGGVIGVVIDHSTGSGYEYPDRIQVVMGQGRTQDRKDQDAAPPAASAPSAVTATAAAGPGPVPGTPAGPRTPVTGDDFLQLSRNLGKVSTTAPPQLHSMDFQPDGVVVANFVNATRRGLYKVSPGEDRLCMTFSIPNEGARTLPYMNDCFAVYRVADGSFVMRAANSDFEVAYQR